MDKDELVSVQLIATYFFLAGSLDNFDLLCFNMIEASYAVNDSHKTESSTL